MKTSALVAVTGVLALAGASFGQTAFGVTADNRLVSFGVATPGSILSNVAITGLGAGEVIRGLDARPLTGELWIMTSASRLLTVNPATGAATTIGAGFTPGLDPQVAAYGIDFNPTVDRLRVVDSSAGNRRLNPLTGGAVQADTALTYNDGSGLTPRAVGTAYTNALFGQVVPAGSTRQFIIDSARDILGEVGSQAGGNASFNGGVVTPIGALGFNLSDNAGFDIFGPAGVAYVSSLDIGGATQFYTLNLATGAASLVGTIGGGLGVTDITVVPAPGAATLLGLGVALAARRRR